ncbi:MAG: glycoside hydrolase family 2, partial [Actinobacteria bacterium]|nr:glycoside hydrolase family 2 [Actinomycetota bacterium]
MKYEPIIFIILLAFATSAKSDETTCRTINLAGDWRCKIDVTRDFRIRKRFRHKLEFPYTAHLPGSLDENRLGIRTMGKNPWHLNREYEYVGPVVYQRDVDIPESWQGKEITLYLERCHWETKLYVDDIYFDMRESLSTPHIYDLSEVLTPGKHSLSIRVNNTMKYNIGSNAHAITEHTQTNWNGIIGKIELQARDRVHIGEVQLYADVENISVRVHLIMHNNSGGKTGGTLIFAAENWNAKRQHAARAISRRITLQNKETVIELVYPLGKDALLWDEFNPAMYHMRISFSGQSGQQKFHDEKTVDFGLREFKTKGRQFTVNGRPTFLRGTLECCIFPLTGYPDMSVDGWLRIFRIARSYG